MADVLQGADVVHTEKLNYREALSKWNLIVFGSDVRRIVLLELLYLSKMRCNNSIVQERKNRGWG